MLVYQRVIVLLENQPFRWICSNTWWTLPVKPSLLRKSHPWVPFPIFQAEIPWNHNFRWVNSLKIIHFVGEIRWNHHFCWLQSMKPAFLPDETHLFVGSLKTPVVAPDLNDDPPQESVVAAEQEAHEANLATAHCAKEAAVAKHEAHLAVEWLGPPWLVTNLWNYWIYLWNSMEFFLEFYGL